MMDFLIMLVNKAISLPPARRLNHAPKGLFGYATTPIFRRTTSVYPKRRGESPIRPYKIVKIICTDAASCVPFP